MWDLSSTKGILNILFPYQMMFVSLAINTTGANNGAVTAYLSGAHGFNLDFWWGCVAQSLVLCLMVFRSLYFPFLLVIVLPFSIGHCFTLFYWLLYCLSFFDLRFLIFHPNVWYL